MLKDKDEKVARDGVVYALSLAFELGFIIAIPAVGLALGGRVLDSKFGTAPVFILFGICAAILLSSYFVYQKIVKITES